MDMGVLNTLTVKQNILDTGKTLNFMVKVYFTFKMAIFTLGNFDKVKQMAMVNLLVEIMTEQSTEVSGKTIKNMVEATNNGAMAKATWATSSKAKNTE